MYSIFGIWLAFATLSCATTSLATSSPFIIGTYNTTFWSVPLPSCVVKALVPIEYEDSLPTPDSLGNIPVVVELGREANCGPVDLNFLNFQEAKLEVPSIRRVSNSSTRFTYKKVILVDALIDVPTSFLIYGLDTLPSAFTPINSSFSSTLDYVASLGLGATNIVLDELQRRDVPDTDFESTADQPWFGDGLQCAQHIYDFTNATERYRVRGTVSFPTWLLRTNNCSEAAGSTISVPNASGLHIVADFGIYGPALCESYAQ